MAKKVYLVRGSEDGTLGVFTSLKKAYIVAYEYAVGGWSFRSHETTTITTEKYVRSIFKLGSGEVAVNAGGSYEAYATIEAHILL